MPRSYGKHHKPGNGGGGGGDGARPPARAPTRAPKRPRPEVAAPAPVPPAKQRLAKAMARAGLCSRRVAENWIAAGRVTVNGHAVDGPALDVGPQDAILVDGTPLPVAEGPRIWRYHKPRGLITSARDERGRPGLFDALPANLPRVISVGRLDMNSEGLLLLTNDGDLARQLELPSVGLIRRYRVRVRGRVDQVELDKLADGVTVDGVRYGPITATIARAGGSNIWLDLSLREGKNREVRRIMEHLDCQVNRLIRTGFGPFALDDLAPGTLQEVPASRFQALIAEAVTGTGTGKTGKRGWRTAAKSPRPKRPRPHKAITTPGTRP